MLQCSFFYKHTFNFERNKDNPLHHLISNCGLEPLVGCDLIFAGTPKVASSPHAIDESDTVAASYPHKSSVHKVCKNEQIQRDKFESLFIVIIFKK